MIKSFCGLPIREKVIKLILMALIVAAAVIVFPKNYKIAVQNYEERREMVVLTDPLTGQSREAWYFFQQGYYYITPITRGPVKELLIGDEPDNVHDVSVYYGSAKVGSGSSLTSDTLITYNIPKIVLLIALYALFCLSAAAAGVTAVLSWHPRGVWDGFLCTDKKLSELILSRSRISKKDAVLFLGLTAFYSLLVFIISENILIKDIYPMEICFAAVILFITLLVLKQYSGDTLWTALSSLPIYVCLYFSVNKICAFTFIDGAQAISEQTELVTDSLRHFQKNTARLNYIIMGTFERYNIIGRLDGFTAAKLVHWFFGAALFVYLVYFAVKHLLPQKGVSACAKVFRFTSLFVMVFTFNYTLTALKNYNYDLFSMAFGAIGFAYFLYAARTNSKKRAAAAIVISTLGALEKQIVWPFILLCMLEYVILSVADDKKGRPYIMGLVYTLKAALITIAVSLCCNLWIQHVVRWDDFPRFTVNNLIRPIQGLMHSFIRRLPLAWDPEGTALYVVGNIAGWICVYAGFLILRAISRYYRRVITIVLCVFSICVVFITIAQCYQLIPANRFIRIFWYLQASMDAFPTVILAGFLIALIICIIRNKNPEMAVFICLFVSIVPITYSFFSGEATGRYFNVFGLGAILSLFLFMAENLGSIKMSRATGLFGSAAGIVVFALIFAEGVVFAPAYLNYFPVWDKTFIGSLFYNPVGVEKQTAGEALLRYYDENNLDASNVELYVNYGAQWNAKPNGWVVDVFPAAGIHDLGSTTIDDISFGEDVYYVFTSRAYVTGRYYFYPLPSDEYTPFMTLKRRDTVEAWVYRADDLRTYFEAILPQSADF